MEDGNEAAAAAALHDKFTTIAFGAHKKGTSQSLIVTFYPVVLATNETCQRTVPLFLFDVYAFLGALHCAKSTVRHVRVAPFECIA